MQFQTIKVHKSDGVAVLTLNRPQKLNAVNLEMRLEVLEALKELERDDNVLVIIITGSGEAFCAGADISEFDSKPAREKNKDLDNLVRFIYELEKPVIGAINGVSAGAGSQWLLAFDLNVASEKATFAWPAARLGIC
jgi:enoyl-CoA hydratase/carnithine racemase